jgi:hypothetical protein
VDAFSEKKCRAGLSRLLTTSRLCGPSHRLGHLTSTPPAIIIVVANVSFRPRLTGRGSEGTVGHNPTVGVT